MAAEATRAAASERAELVWAKTTVPDEDHPYLVKRGVKPHGVRQYGETLVVPIWDAGRFRSLQFIYPDGTKRFLKGGALQDSYFHIGTAEVSAPASPQDTICIAEGFATGASINEATGYVVAVAFDAGRLLTVGRRLRKRHPMARLVFCADDDHRTQGNPGIDKATKAAREVGGYVAVPRFGANRPDDATDFNDLRRLHGDDPVVACIRDAKVPETPTPPQVGASALPGQGTDDWPEPMPLPSGLPPVADFDLAMLPGTVEPWGRDICDRMQCSPDFVGATIMAALGSVLGRKVAVCPQRKTDWVVIANQWALIVGRPGVLKFPAMEAALQPLKRLEAKAAEFYRAEALEFEVASRMAKIQADAGEKAAREKVAKDPHADVSDLLRSADLEPPTMRRYIANDTTAAALGELHRTNSEARGFYLTGWNGDSQYTIDRIGRGMNLHIPGLCISLIGSTQPGRIARYVRAAVEGGVGDDGLIQRFGLTVFPDVSGKWKDVDRVPDSAARRETEAIFEHLSTLDPPSVGAIEDDAVAIPYLRLDPAAHEYFLEWRIELERRLRSGELHVAVESHLSKYRKLVPGLALIIHLAERATGPVGERAMVRAVSWSRYLETHAQRLYASGLHQEVATAKAIVAKLRHGKLARTFSIKDVYHNQWTGLSDPKSVRAALELLADYDWLGVTTIRTPGPNATVYTANPRMF